MMKYLITILAVLVLSFLSQTPAFATWTHVQGTTKANAGSNTGTIAQTYGSAVTAGNLGIICVSAVTTSNAALSATISDGTNTWTLAKITNLQNISNDWYCAGIYYTIFSGSSAYTETVTLSNTFCYPTISIDEYSFTPGTVSISSTGTGASATNGTGAFASTGNVTFTTPSALVIAIAQYDNVGTFTAGSGFAIREQVSEVSGHCEGLGMEDWLNASSSPVTVGMTTSGSGNHYWTMSSATFQSSGDTASTSNPAALLPGM